MRFQLWAWSEGGGGREAGREGRGGDASHFGDRSHRPPALLSQVGFDSASVAETERLQHARSSREQAEVAGIDEICGARIRSADDVEALTALYRTILHFLLSKAGLSPGEAHSRPAQREVAAALESVFPRSGLPAFTALSPSDKAAQLFELANIVLGIRLFNRHIGKGGAGIADVPAEAAGLATSLGASVCEELAGVRRSAERYVPAITEAYRTGDEPPLRLQADLTRLCQCCDDAHLSHETLLTCPPQAELTHLRQYAAFLGQLDDALRQAAARVEELARLLIDEMEALKALVGSRASVPKEQVFFPSFDLPSPNVGGHVSRSSSSC